MKFLYFLITLVLVSCKTTKTNIDSFENTWTQIDSKIEKDKLQPKVYASYQLKKEAFSKQLASGLIYLPIEKNSYAVFEVENSNTMSDALQEKYPQLKSYKGIQQSNSLCQCRIDQNELNFSITILCNDATFYINDLYKDGIFYFYNKKDLPAGVGQINE